MGASRSPKWKDRAPRLVRKQDGSDVWVFEGRQIPNVGLNAVAGRPPEEYGMEPTALEQLRPGCYDVDARVADMNANGVLGSLCFPTVPGFVGELFGERAKAGDGELAVAIDPRPDHPAFIVRCRGQGARPPTHLVEFLTGQNVPPIDALTVQTYYTCRLAQGAGIRLEVLKDGADIILSARALNGQG